MNSYNFDISRGIEKEILSKEITNFVKISSQKTRKRQEIKNLSLKTGLVTMCGIIGIFDLKNSSSDYRKKALDMASCIRHRGPDWSGIYSDEKAVIAHERLSIVDPTSGSQPLFDKKADRVLAVNGEIYNYKELQKKIAK